MLKPSVISHSRHRGATPSVLLPTHVTVHSCSRVNKLDGVGVKRWIRGGLYLIITVECQRLALLLLRLARVPVVESHNAADINIQS